MSLAKLDLSVVIPTHNRADRLVETLDALTRQDMPAARFEVIVVLDKATDDSAERLKARQWPFALKIERSQAGRASFARNIGAKSATSPRLVFLDDDITVSPSFLTAHAKGLAEDQVIVGAPIPVFETPNWIQKRARDWWQGEIARMEHEDTRASFQRLLSGNFSINAKTFWELDGFDQSLATSEDYELGYRLLKSGREILFSLEAWGEHYDATDSGRTFQRAEADGRSQAAIARKYPELLIYLRLAELNEGPRVWWARKVAFDLPWIREASYRIYRALMPGLERCGLSGLWGRAHDRARANRYNKGVADELGSFGAYTEIAGRAESRERRVAILQADILDGEETILAQFRTQRPDAVSLNCAGDRIDATTVRPWSQKLTEAELKRFIASKKDAWLPFAKAAEKLVLPAADRLDPGAAPIWRLGGTFEVGSLDIGTGKITPSLSEVSYPARYLIRHQGNLVSWFTLWSPPDRASATRELRNKLLQDWRIRNRLLTLDFETPRHPEEAPISVAVCTRDRPHELKRCLQSIMALDYTNYEVVVIDNNPPSDATRQVVQGFPGVRYVREDQPGGTAARNRAIDETRHALIAYADDDTKVDAGWLKAINAGFQQDEVQAITGFVAPMKLDTNARVYFEDTYGGMGKGFDPFWWRGEWLTENDRLWAPACGVGANMAFRKKVFETAGRFDTHLGPGVVTSGGEDIELFHRLLTSGATLLYEPRALVWHEHRLDYHSLKTQLNNNGRAFVCYLLTCWHNRTVSRGQILRFTLSDWVYPWLIKRLIRPHGHSRGLVWAELKGALDGRRAFRRARRSGDA